MIENPMETAYLIAGLKAALPFEVQLMPPLVRALRAQQLPVDSLHRYAVSDVCYAGEHDGILCQLELSNDASEQLARVHAPIDHVRVPVSMPLARQIDQYQTERYRKRRSPPTTP